MAPTNVRNALPVLADAFDNDGALSLDGRRFGLVVTVQIQRKFNSSMKQADPATWENLKVIVAVSYFVFRATVEQF
jgi:hypothetical protein